MKRRVLKLGGSLLDLPDLNERLQRWLAEDQALVNLIVVGGGEIVEAVRAMERVHKLDHAFVHWLCVDLLGHTLQIATQVLTGIEAIRTEQELQNYIAHPPSQPFTACVDVRTFYRRGRANFGLPENWDTTSDSIAAALAHVVDADELVLLKSRQTRDLGLDYNAWANGGLVDRAFPTLANRLKSVRIVDLRS